jgi:hypothetical protein
VPEAVEGLAVLTFHELHQKIKGTMRSGQLWDIYKAIIGADGIIQRVIVMPPGALAAAVEALPPLAICQRVPGQGGAAVRCLDARPDPSGCRAKHNGRQPARDLHISVAGIQI